MKERTGFTKIGFSKGGFSACGRWMYCDTGKKKCYYEEQDSEVKHYCSAYLRQRQQKSTSKGNVTPKEATEGELKENDIEQLSLF